MSRRLLCWVLDVSVRYSSSSSKPVLPPCNPWNLCDNVLHTNEKVLQKTVRYSSSLKPKLPACKNICDKHVIHSSNEEVLQKFVRYASSCCKGKVTASDIMNLCDKHVAQNYCPLPVVLCKGKGSVLYDVDGKNYLDFLSGYAAVSLGHCHPKLCKVVAEQTKVLAHTSRAFYTRTLAEYGEYVTGLFCYDKVLPMNSGTEASETAVKLARKWGYKVKGICPNQAKVLFAENNFWGRSIAAISASSDPSSYRNYGPFVPGFDTVPFSDVDALEVKLRDPNVCAFMVEPIQGEAGVIIPDPCYLKQVRDLCTSNKVLFIADEVQCGLGRCGSLLGCDIYSVKPDILVLGKALSGGLMPISAVLANADIMDVIEPGTHGSTFGGNALSCKVAMAALQILQEEKLIENSKAMGEKLRGALSDLPKDIICEVRGVGLLNAIVLKEGINTWDLCLRLMNHGLLAKSTKNQVIRLSPPLSIKEKEILKASKIIRHCVENSRGSCGGGGGGGGGGESSKSPQSSKKKLSKIFQYKSLSNPLKALSTINKLSYFNS